MDKKNIRVEIEFDDGTIMRLIGEQAELWQKAVESQGVMSAIHGHPFPELKWEKFLKQDS